MSSTTESPPTGGPGPAVRRRERVSAKIVISGGFGVGKTTFVGSISEIDPLRTEESITAASVGTDDRSVIDHKTTTTVAMDFGRLTLDEQVVLFLFGTPGQDRFGFMWDELVNGCLGALVIVDTRRLDDCFHAVDYFESRGVPFVVLINRFGGELHHSHDAVRQALAVPADVPIIDCDVRDREAVRASIVSLLDTLIARLPG